MAVGAPGAEAEAAACCSPQAGNTTRVRWGAVGEEGSVSEKEHNNEAAAAKFVLTKIKEKEKGGYVKSL